MLKRTKAILVAGVSVIALAGGTVAFPASGNAAALPATSAAMSAAAPTETPTPTPPPPGTSTKPGEAQHKHMLSRLQHGQFTLTNRNGRGEEVVDVQRGDVTSVNPTSVTVASTDGFAATYVVNASSKVTKDKKESAIDRVHTGDRVFVVATRTGHTSTAKHIIDVSP